MSAGDAVMEKESWRSQYELALSGVDIGDRI
jgi:hypothetical protein